MKNQNPIFLLKQKLNTQQIQLMKKDFSMAFTTQRKKLLESEVKILRSQSSHGKRTIINLRTEQSTQEDEVSRRPQSRQGPMQLAQEQYQNEIKGMLSRMNKMQQKIQEMQYKVMEKDEESENLRK